MYIYTCVFFCFNFLCIALTRRGRNQPGNGFYERKEHLPVLYIYIYIDTSIY